MTDDSEILDEFLLEGREIIDQLDLDFVALEKSPSDEKLLGNIFRGMHTLKGSSGFFSFKRLELVSHAGESLLSKLRDKSLVLSTDMVTVLLETLDRLRSIIDSVESEKKEAPGDDQLLLFNLRSLAEGGPLYDSLPDEESSDGEAKNAPEDNGQVQQQLSAPERDVSDKFLSDEIKTNSSLSPDTAQEPPGSPEAESMNSESYQDVRSPSVMEDSVVNLGEEDLSSDIGPAAESQDIKISSSESGPPVKVSVELLDTLMNLVSEMVLARNRLLTYSNEMTDPKFAGIVRNVDMITLELQERMMKTRMSPIGQVWSKFPRLVRDLSRECNKEVELVQIGAETELDRTLLESIRDPLIHIVRNSIDHGLESLEDRRSLNKPESGKVTLSARHENGMVVVEVSDDGAGINIDKVRAKAVERSLVKFQDAQEMSDEELLEYIYLPGFSTKDKITNLSGRGVGMDVVRTNISNIGGGVELKSSDKGTIVRLKIPLTLAIMPALFVRCEDEKFAIPQNNLLEMVRYKREEGGEGVEYLYGVPVFRLREKIVPLVFLGQELSLSNAQGWEGIELQIAIVQASGIRFGLIVDEVLHMQEVVVKPISAVLKTSGVYGGATILGDGHVSLILDIDGIARKAGLATKLREHKLYEQTDKSAEIAETDHAMLLFDLGGTDRLAIPLSQVDRLEVIEPSRLEQTGKETVVAYGDGVMKLVSIGRYIDGTPNLHRSRNAEKISVIVYYSGGLPVGLVVNQIHDIVYVPDQLNIISPPQRGLLGCALIDDRIVNVVDVDEILHSHNERNAVRSIESMERLTVDEPL